MSQGEPHYNAVLVITPWFVLHLHLTVWRRALNPLLGYRWKVLTRKNLMEEDSYGVANHS